MALRVGPLSATSAILLVAVLSGCIAPSPTVYVLEYEIIELEETDNPRAHPGAHCQDAVIEDDLLTIWLWPGQEQPSGPWLAVFVTLPDSWPETGDQEPYKTALPATVTPDIDGDTTPLGELEWGRLHGLRLDGEKVTLPHSWSRTATDGSWVADATLHKWDKEVQVDRYKGGCD